MGQAFDREGQVIASATGHTKREVFDRLTEAAPDAAEIRIRTFKEFDVPAVLEMPTCAVPSASGPDEPSAELPRYRCYKEVWALKIRTVTDPTERGDESDGSRLLHFEEAGYGVLRVEHDYVRKHNPQAGGYYVVYRDGYKSFSPAVAFEQGYTRI
ncbi:MAG: hypothetical protein KKB31_08030 [Nanoarchaeota archaeon]|nr:hypothetical protein [Nanoarchaeota archaeon]